MPVGPLASDLTATPKVPRESETRLGCQGKGSKSCRRRDYKCMIPRPRPGAARSRAILPRRRLPGPVYTCIDSLPGRSRVYKNRPLRAAAQLFTWAGS
eukprot:3457332-Rhodomonas_salina.3